MSTQQPSLREAILKKLESNARIDLSEIAILLGVNEIDVINEVAAMENENIICGYNTLIDWDKTGTDIVTALIEVKITPQRSEGYDRIAERIHRFPDVQSCYLISGSFDLLVIVKENNLRDVSRFVSEKLSSVGEIVSISTHFILKRYKDFGISMDGEIATERLVVSP